MQNLGVNNVTTRVARSLELNSEGITKDMRNPSHIGNYWLGSNEAGPGTHVRCVDNRGEMPFQFVNCDNQNWIGVRPIICINIE